MLKNYITNLLQENLSYSATAGQNILIEKLANFIIEKSDEQIFLLKGYAGTGKTTVMQSLVKSLKQQQINSILLAPTGRAAKVLSNITEKQAFTIHKNIYRQQTSSNGMGRFDLDFNKNKNTIFIVDEASMIANNSSEKSIFGSGKLLDDLLFYVYNDKNCKLILIGDTAQLPPVKLEISPALDKFYLEGYGKEVVEVNLKDVVRQSEGSGILHNATNLRNLLTDFTPKFPKFILDNFSDIEKITGGDLIEKISDAYGKYGMQDSIILTRSNKRANRYNQGIRNTILYRENEIESGDYLMVVKNNYFWLQKEEEDIYSEQKQKTPTSFIANGDVAEVLSINNFQELYGFRFADVRLRFLDYEDLEIDTKIILDTLSSETASLNGEQFQQLFLEVEKDYQYIKTKRKRYEAIKEDEFFNALQVKFSYAITCHKAQGGQWDCIFIDSGYITENHLNIEFIRWLYTAVTRATKKLYLVNFKDDFFN